MHRRQLAALAVGITFMFTACHKNSPPVVVPTTDTTAPPPAPPPPPPPPPPAATTSNTNLDSVAAGRVTSMTERIHFDYNVSDIRPDDRATLDQKAAMMKNFDALRIRITGHCDERGSDEYNIALGMRRAAAAKNYLVQAGVDPSRIEVASLGSEVPINPASTEAAWAQNRRDEFDIIAGSQSLRAP